MSCIKRVLGLFLVLVMIWTGVVVPTNASATNDFREEDENIVSSEVAEKIDALYRERSELSLNFEANQLRISMIDKELEELGVEDISYEELLEKMDIPATRWNVSSTSTVKWTSTRTNVVYQGKSFQLQIVRGTPATQQVSNSSGLLRYYTTNITKCSLGTAMKNIFSIGAVAGAQSIPVVGSAIGTIHTFYDVFRGAISGLTPTSTVDNVEGTYSTSMSSNEVFVFVKHQGDADLGNQLLCYVGNDIRLKTAVVFSSPVKVNGSFVAGLDVGTFEGNVTSKNYSSYSSVACSNFWKYYYSNQNFLEDYRVSRVNLTTCSGVVYLNAPQAAPNLS